MPKLSFILSLLALLGPATGAAGQDTDDWDVVVDSDQNLIVAGVQYAGGVSINVQCHSDRLNLIITGVPTSSEPFRAFSLTREDGLSRKAYLVPAPDGVHWTSEDARAVRFLKSSGKVTITSAAGETHPVRVEVDLPTQSTNLDRVLTSCGYPLTDTRDQLSAVTEFLLAPPRFDMPESAMDRFPRHATAVRVEISCLISQSRLSACQSDHETPRAPEVGVATARRANGTRVSLSDAAAAEGMLLDVVLTGSRVYRRAP